MLLGVHMTDDVLHRRWWRGFPVLNALQSLANLATLQGTSAETADYAPEYIIKRAWDTIEDAWQSDATALRTAATELILNLTQAQGGMAKFDPRTDSRAPHRWRIMSAYFGDEHVPLRSAAGGALAGLVGDQDGAVAFAGTPHGLEYLVESLDDKDVGMQARGAAICYGLAAAASSKGQGADTVRGALQRANLRAACEAAVKKPGCAPETRDQLIAVSSMLQKL